MKTASPIPLDTLLAHRDFVRRVATCLLRDPSDVDEVEQRTWLSSLGLSGEAPRELRAWLHRVVRNHSLNLLRSRERSLARERAAAAHERAEDAELVAQRLDTARALVERVTSLPEHYRTVLILRYYEGLSVRAIAKRLGTSATTVKGRLQRGLAALREDLGRGARGEAWRRELAALVAAPAVVTTKGLGIAAAVLVLAGGAWWMLRPAAAAPEPARVTFGAVTPSGASGAPASPAAAVAATSGARTGRVAIQDSASSGDVLAGEFTLRIGEAFVFGLEGPQPDDDRGALDLLCQDIRHGASLACFVGAVEATAPLTSFGLPKEPARAFALLRDAPEHLPQRDLWLLEGCTAQRSGLGFVRARNGRVYKLCLVDLEPHPEALKRSVRIRYEAVEPVEDGGRFLLPNAEGRPDDATLKAIEEALAWGERIPGQNMHGYLRGDFEQIEGWADVNEVVVEGGRALVSSEPVTANVRLGADGKLFAADGIASGARVELKRGGLGVVGAMDGTIRLDGYSYVSVDGPMNGTIEVGSYATLFLGQGLQGTLKIRSYTDVFVRGPILGTIDAHGSCWSTFYFDRYVPSWELEEAGDDFDQVTLHVRRSDLAPGEHEGVGSWRKVIVADPFWDTIP